MEPDNRLGALPGGTALTAFEPDGDWYPVQLNDGRTGWMHRSVLGPKPPRTSAAGLSTPTSQLPVVRLGIVQDGKVFETDVTPIFKREIRDWLRGEYRVEFPQAVQLQGEWTVTSVRAALDRLLANPRVDMILALGALASHAAGQRGNLAKPVFAPFVINAHLGKRLK